MYSSISTSTVDQPSPKTRKDSFSLLSSSSSTQSTQFSSSIKAKEKKKKNKRKSADEGTGALDDQVYWDPPAQSQIVRPIIDYPKLSSPAPLPDQLSPQDTSYPQPLPTLARFAETQAISSGLVGLVDPVEPQPEIKRSTDGHPTKERPKRKRSPDGQSSLASTPEAHKHRTTKLYGWNKGSIKDLTSKFLAQQNSTKSFAESKKPIHRFKKSSGSRRPTTGSSSKTRPS